jgi:hypothetical protein
MNFKTEHELETEINGIEKIYNELRHEKLKLFNKLKNLDLRLQINKEVSDEYTTIVFDEKIMAKKITELNEELKIKKGTCNVCKKKSNKVLKICYTCGKRVHDDCGVDMCMRYTYMSGYKHERMYFCNNDQHTNSERGRSEKDCFNIGIKKYSEKCKLFSK